VQSTRTFFDFTRREQPRLPYWGLFIRQRKSPCQKWYRNRVLDRKSGEP